jgi:uncharacterized membrane protein YoaK (UPF0700 family)
VIIVSFAVGGVIGAILFDHLQFATLYVPAALTGVVGIGYTAYAHTRRLSPAA